MWTSPAFASRDARAGQRGVVVVFALIALVVMLIGAVAMMRSMNTSQFTIGNLGFKRDLTNQSELALQRILNDFRTGSLSTPLSRESNLVASNYSATLLASNPQGIPLVLLGGTGGGFTGVGSTANDVTGAGGVTLRYVIDRMSTATGPCGPSTCVLATQSVPGGSFSEWNNAQNNNGVGGVGAAPPQPIYRLTVQATGPRGTQSYYQSTFTF